MPSHNLLHSESLLVERARVVAIDTSSISSVNAIWVETFQQSSCGSCASKDTCGQGVLNRWFGRRSHSYRVLCDAEQLAQCSIGQWVEITVPQGVIVQAALLAYIVPLIVMCLFSVVAEAIFATDLLSIAAGFSGLLLGFYGIKRYERGFANDISRQPKLLRTCN